MKKGYRNNGCNCYDGLTCWIEVFFSIYLIEFQSYESDCQFFCVFRGILCGQSENL